MTSLKTVLLVVAIATIGVGVFILDWVEAEVSISGFTEIEAASGLDLDAGKISVVTGAVAGALGLTGLNKVLNPRLAGLLLIVGAAVVAAVTLDFLSKVEDETITFGGFTIVGDVSLAEGGPVTLVGSALLAFDGLLFVAIPERRRAPTAAGRERVPVAG